jgi:glycosyltransferase involved in cell wall biosynthesis
MRTTKWRDLNLSRLQLLFALPDSDLSAVKSLAHGFVLPIPFGGGSNIKTAEALYSGKYVVGTPAAFRGYERYSDLPEVRVGPDPKCFHAAIRNVLMLPPATAMKGTEGYEKRQQLRWDKSLEGISQTIDKLRRKGMPRE